MDEAFHQSRNHEDLVQFTYLFIEIAKFYKTYGNVAKGIEILKEGCEKVKQGGDLASICDAMRSILSECPEVAADNEGALEIMKQGYEAIDIAKNLLSNNTNQDYKYFSNQGQIDRLISVLFKLECKKKSCEQAKKTLDLMFNPHRKSECLIDLAGTLMKEGKYDEGRQLLSEAIHLLNQPRNNNDITFTNPKKDIERILASHGFLDEALEFIKKNDEIDPYSIENLIDLQIKNENLDTAKHLLNHLPQWSDEDITMYIEPVLKVARLMSKKSSLQERDSFTGQTFEALELTTLAKTHTVPKFAFKCAWYLDSIAIVEAVIGDFNRSQGTLLEAKKLLEHCKDSSRNDNVVKLACRQSALHDFDGALQSLELVKEKYDYSTKDFVKDNLDNYVEALIGIHKAAKPLFRKLSQ